MFTYSESNFRTVTSDITKIVAKALGLDPTLINVDFAFSKQDETDCINSAEISLITLPRIPNDIVKPKRVVKQILEHFEKKFECNTSVKQIKTHAAQSNSRVVMGHFDNIIDMNEISDTTLPILSGCVTVTTYNALDDDRVSITLIASFEREM